MVNILYLFFFNEVLACSPKMNVRHLTPVEISSNQIVLKFVIDLILLNTANENNVIKSSTNISTPTVR